MPNLVTTGKIISADLTRVVEKFKVNNVEREELQMFCVVEIFIVYLTIHLYDCQCN